MQRIWKNYNKWEDYKAGMFNGKIQDGLIPLIVDYFNGDGFARTLSIILDKWPECMNHNLSYAGSNRQSYLRQACCAYEFGASIKTTTKAWGLLSEEIKTKSNSLADDLIKLYEEKYYISPEVKISEKLS